MEEDARRVLLTGAEQKSQTWRSNIWSAVHLHYRSRCRQTKQQYLKLSATRTRTLSLCACFAWNQEACICRLWGWSANAKGLLGFLLFFVY